MKTKILKQTDLDEATKMLQNGEVIAFPTETVFGLGVIFDNPNAYQKLVDVKKRPPLQPFTLMCSEPSDIEKYVDVTPKLKKIIDKYMPGPLTIIAPLKTKLPLDVTLGTGFIGIRISDLDLIKNLIKKVGKPLLVPSANPHGATPALTLEETINYFDGQIAGVIEGNVHTAKPSTIIKVNGKIELIREGPIPFNEILELVKEV
jgi:L-threonylcarbamoyladenylate synthase